VGWSVMEGVGMYHGYRIEASAGCSCRGFVIGIVEWRLKLGDGNMRR
jgi:hypothetical protein